jgi:hypothetical protein
MEFVLDLGPHEQTRLAAVLNACDGLYDPLELLAGEQAATRLLYSQLDAEQSATLAMLQATGVIPPLSLAS